MKYSSRFKYVAGGFGSSGTSARALRLWPFRLQAEQGDRCYCHAVGAFVCVAGSAAALSDVPSTVPLERACRSACDQALGAGLGTGCSCRRSQPEEHRCRVGGVGSHREARLCVAGERGSPAGLFAGAAPAGFAGPACAGPAVGERSPRPDRRRQAGRIRRWARRCGCCVSSGL